MAEPSKHILPRYALREHTLSLMHMTTLIRRFMSNLVTFCAIGFLHSAFNDAINRLDQAP